MALTAKKVITPEELAQAKVDAKAELAGKFPELTPTPSPAPVSEDTPKNKKELTPTKVDSFNLSKEVVLKLTSIDTVNHERPRDDKHVAKLRKEALAHNLVTFNWAVATLNGKQYRVNGQHSSKMLLDLYNENNPEMVKYLDKQWVAWSWYDIESDRDLVRLFRKFDTPMSVRSKADVSTIYKNSVEPLRSLDNKKTKIAIDGIAWYKRRIQKTKMTEDEIYEIVYDEDVHSFLKWANTLRWENMSQLKKAPIIGAMFATHSVDEEAANKFWRDVARGGDQDEDYDAAKVLDEWLDRAAKKKITPRIVEFYQGCIFAWNAYRNGRELKQGIKPEKGMDDPE